MLSARGRGGRIRAPRRGLSAKDVDFDALWDILDKAFREIHSKNASQLSFEELYRSAYKLVLKKKGDLLYDKVKELESELLVKDVKTRIVALVAPSLFDTTTSAHENSAERRIAGERFIRALQDSFKDHQLCMGLITDVLMYMDRLHTSDLRKPSIFTAAMGLFRDQVLRSPASDVLSEPILDLLESTILHMIQLERSGEVIERSLVRACCNMLEHLYETWNEEETSRLYLTSFEPKFLTASRSFYRSEGKQLLKDADASTFCSHARRRLKEEDERCKQTLSVITEHKIRSVVETELISAHMRDVINLPGTGVKNMLDNDKYDDLTNMYDLIARVDPRKLALKEAVQKRVVEAGTEINNNTSVTATEKTPKPPVKPDPAGSDKSADKPAAGDKALNQQTTAAITWVEEVLRLKSKYDKLWERAFKKDNNMEKALELSFQDFINANARSPEHLSLFLDEYLKRGGKGKTEAEVDILLDNGVTLLQYLADKDLFESYYKKHMAKRLLNKKSISRDIERQILSKMKIRLGNQFTQKMEGLLRDIELSESLNSQYKDHVNQLGDPDPQRIDMEASILTTTVWPLTMPDAGTPECNYPASIERVKKRFEKFYLDKHTGRKLTWLLHMGDASLRATFRGAGGKARRYDITVPTYSMIILMLFNDLANGEGLTFEQIQAETNIPEQNLIRNLQTVSLIPKWRLLKKEPMSKEINPTDKFFFNEGFTSQFLRIKVALVTEVNRVENSEERKETKKKADEERGHAVEAAIVRIMKARKTLTHQQLMTETLQQLSMRFQPDVNMIKRKIESLIDREYLERGPDPAQALYNYLA